ncbi:hypothetical protein ScPMuIL_014733 [Solemya velum]
MDNPNFLRRIAKRLRLEEPVGIEDSISDTDGDSQDANTDFYDRGYADNPPIEEEPQKTVPEKKDKTVEDSFVNKCEYNTNLNSIIRSTDSLKAGAFFLKFFNNITAQECVSGCCDTQGCNLAVYENKGNRSCYLFNCPDDKSCTFAHHNDYMGMSFPHISSVPTHEKDQDRHEGELEGLGKNNGILPPEKVPLKDSDLTTTVPTTPKTTPPESLPPQAVVCGESQFKCVARDTEKLKCYDLSARCDGVAQCADSSDEQDCAFKNILQEANGANTILKPPIQSNGQIGSGYHQGIQYGNRPTGFIDQNYPSIPLSNIHGSGNRQMGTFWQPPEGGLSPPVPPQMGTGQQNMMAGNIYGMPQPPYNNRFNQLPVGPLAPPQTGQQFYNQNTGFVPQPFSPNNQIVGDQFGTPFQHGQQLPMSQQRPQTQGHFKGKVAPHTRIHSENPSLPREHKPTDTGIFSSDFDTDGVDIDPTKVLESLQNKANIKPDSSDFGHGPTRDHDIKGGQPPYRFGGLESEMSVKSERKKTTTTTTSTTTSTTTTTTTMPPTTESTTSVRTTIASKSKNLFQEQMYHNRQNIEDRQEDQDILPKNLPHMNQDYRMSRPRKPLINGKSNGHFRGQKHGKHRQYYPGGEPSRYAYYPDSELPEGYNNMRYDDYDYYNNPQNSYDYDPRPNKPTAYDYRPYRETEEPSLDGDENNDAAHTDKSSENMSEDSDNSGNVPDKKSGSEPEQKSGSVPVQKSESVTSQGDINSENVSLNRTVTHGDTVVVVEETDNLLEEQDVVVVASPTDNAQGPIVALALGLAITLILLIFVGCRLRNVKRRLRKGRALHSNEADYLINGMYL